MTKKESLTNTLSDLKKVIYTYLYRLQAGDNVMVSHLTQNFMKLWSNGRYNKDKKSILYEYNICCLN